MQVFQLNKKFWRFLGLHKGSGELKEDTNDFLKTFQSWLIVLGFIILMIGYSVKFIVNNITDFDGVTVEIEVLCAGVQGLGAFIPVGLKLLTAKRLIFEIQTLADKGIFPMLSYISRLFKNNSTIYYSYQYFVIQILC